MAGGVVAVLACAAADLALLAIRGPLGLLNDFNIYWSAARVLAGGGNPYSWTAVSRAHSGAGLSGVMGAGYVYPPAFIEAFRPLGSLTPRAAAAAFIGLSLLALAAGVALLLGSMPRLSWPKALVLGALAGLFPPVVGALWVGQANLLLLPALALAYRGVAPGLWLMVASAVKIYPGVGLVALAGRRDRLRQVGQAAAAGVALLVAPAIFGMGAGGFSRELGGNLTADAYPTNQSMTGFLTRMALSQGWPLRGIPEVYSDGVAVALLAVAAACLLWARRFQPWEGSLAVSLSVGVLLAPRNSLWNYAPLLLAFAFAVPRLKGRPWLSVALAGGYLLTALQPLVWSLTTEGGTVAVAEYSSSLVAWTSSLGLYGGLAISLVCARLVNAERRPADRVRAGLVGTGAPLRRRPTAP